MLHLLNLVVNWIEEALAGWLRELGGGLRHRGVPSILALDPTRRRHLVIHEVRQAALVGRCVAAVVFRTGNRLLNPNLPRSLNCSKLRLPHFPLTNIVQIQFVVIAYQMIERQGFFLGLYQWFARAFLNIWRLIRDIFATASLFIIFLMFVRIHFTY